MSKKYAIFPILFGMLTLTSCEIPFFSFPMPSYGPIDPSTSVSFDTSKEEVSGTYLCSSKYIQKQIGDTTGEFCLNSLGNQNMLVIPVTVKGYERNATENNRARLEKAFFGDSDETSWESLSSYYKKSSFGRLNISGTVSDWYECGYTANQIASLTGGGQYSDAFDPTWTILEKAVAWYKQTTGSDCKEFDNDGDGYIDGVWLVYSAPDYSNNATLDSNVFWAYTYADYQMDPKVSSPVGYHYCWGSYDFMNEGYGSGGIDAHTFIHETGHLLGLDDYYDYNEVGTPMGYIDMMDGNIIDHCAYSKFALGWIDPYVVTDSCEIVLKPSSTTGQAIILPTNGGFNGSAFDEYIMMEFYTPDVLNAKDTASSYTNGLRGFTERGVRIYHVDARMATSRYNMTTGSWSNYSYTDVLKNTNVDATVVAHSNTPSTMRYESYNYLNPQYRLIQLIDCAGRNFAKSGKVADNNILFQNNDTFSFASYKSQFPSSSAMNDGTSLSYSATFKEMTEESIKVTISKA